MKPKYVNLEMPSIIGMGAVGPTLALVTATLYSAFDKALNGADWLYPTIMLFLSGVLAIFPAVKAEYSKLLKLALWPVAAAIIFASAWTSSTGMSMGEEKISDMAGGFSMANKMTAPMPPETIPTDVPFAPVSTEPDTNVLMMVSEFPEYNTGERSLNGKFFKRMK